MLVILFVNLVVVVSLIAAGRRRLENALPVFAFFVVLTPLESRLVVPGLFDLSTLRVALVTLLALFITKRQRTKTFIPLKRLMALHALWGLCSTFYSLSVATSTKQLIAQVIEYYLLYYIILRTVSDVRTVYKILYSMAIALGICCVFAMFEAYASWSILRLFPSNLWTTYGSNDPLYIEMGRGLRVRSTFPHPILFGDALAMTIPVTFYLLSVWKVGWQRSVLWLALVLMFWAVYKTSSRGPWLATGISAVLLFVMAQNRLRTYLTGMTVLSVIALVARPGIWQTIMNLYQATQSAASPVGSSYEYRHALLDAIMNAVAREPGRMLFGYGLGTFRELGLDINFLNSVQHWYTCDNNWAAFLYETGYVGLFLVGVLLLRPLLMTLRNYQRLPKPERYLSGVFFISLSAFYFLLLSVAGYSWGQQGFMAWILLSLSVAYPKIVLRHRKEAKVPVRSELHADTASVWESVRGQCVRTPFTAPAGSAAE